MNISITTDLTALIAYRTNLEFLLSIGRADLGNLDDEILQEMQIIQKELNAIEARINILTHKNPQGFGPDCGLEGES